MTGFWEAIFLGIVQGLTEFLPVSSSGHLALFTAILGSERLPEENLIFTLLLHAATAIATIIVFRKDVAEIIFGLFEKNNFKMKHFTGHIIISMIPATLTALLLENEITFLFETNLSLVGAMLCVTAFILFFTDRYEIKNQPLNYKIAFLIGIAQAIAILPGISRSGATIATALLIGISRQEAAKFSFLMVIPLILGSMMKSIIYDMEVIYNNMGILDLTAGFIAALLFGVLACNWMIAIVKQSKISYFAVYCILVGLTSCIVAWI